MREKAAKDIEILAEHEIMELVLSYVFVRGNNNPLAHALIKKYKTVYNVLHAPAGELAEFYGIGKAAAEKLRQIHLLYKRIMLAEKAPKVFMGSPGAMKEYMQVLFMNLTEEHLYALYLDQKYNLINKELICAGSKNSADVCLERIVQLAFKHSASNVILAHNHPQAASAPSAADNRLTKRIFMALDACRVNLLEHFIVGESDCYSYYSEGIIETLIEEAARRNKN